MKPSRIIAALILVSATLTLVRTANARAGVPHRGEPLVPAGAPAGEGESFWLHWTAPINISRCPAGRERAIWPTLGVTADGQKLYLAWSDGRDAHLNIYKAMSNNGGDSWSSAQPLVSTVLDSLRPSLVVSESTAWVAWAEDEQANGHTVYQGAWDASAPSLVPNVYRESAVPWLALGPGGELHMALQGGLDPRPDLLYTRRDVGAATWPTATVVYTRTGIGVRDPAIAVSSDGQEVHLVWQDTLGGAASAVRYVRGQRDGETVQWGADVTLSEGITNSVRPAVALATDGTVHVAWGEKESGASVQYVRYRSWSGEPGDDWTAPVRVDPEPVSAHSLAPTDIAPALVALPSTDVVCAAWHGFHADQFYEEVFLTCSPDGGDTWPSPVNVSRSRNTVSIRPRLAAGQDGILHLAWQEYVGPSAVDNYQVYYVHSIPYVVHFPFVARSYR